MSYSIKPLKWEISKNKISENYTAHVPMGTYTVFRNRRDWDEAQPFENWQWSYCFDEYYDESTQDCESLKEGKNKCWEDWIKRILPALKEV